MVKRIFTIILLLLGLALVGNGCSFQMDFEPQRLTSSGK